MLRQQQPDNFDVLYNLGMALSDMGAGPGGGCIQPWQPKDHEMRTLPPEQAVSLLTAWQAAAPEECPYVFMEHGRWEYYRRQVSEGRWRPGLDLVNNFLRRFHTLCRRAGVGPYTIHDLRRSCITNSRPATADPRGAATRGSQRDSDDRDVLPQRA